MEASRSTSKPYELRQLSYIPYTIIDYWQYRGCVHQQSETALCTLTTPLLEHGEDGWHHIMLFRLGCSQLPPFRPPAPPTTLSV